MIPVAMVQSKPTQYIQRYAVLENGRAIQSLIYLLVFQDNEAFTEMIKM